MFAHFMRTAFNPFMLNGISHGYLLEQSVSVLRDVRWYFSFLFKFYKIMQANSGDPDQTPHYVVSDLGLCYLPMSHIKDARHIWVKMQLFSYLIRVAEILEVDC